MTEQFENPKNILKDRAVLLGWIAGLLLLLSLLVVLTVPVQANYLLRSVNSVLINSSDSRRLYEHIQQKQGRAEPFGYWFSMINSDDRMFVFSVFKDGILIPLGAVVSTNGVVEEIIPLSAHAEQIFVSLPDNIIQLYVRRIQTYGER